MILRNVSVLVFAEAEEVAAAADAVVKDPRLARSSVEVRRAGMADAVEWLAQNPSPDVLVIGVPSGPDLWERMETLAENVEPHTRVVVVGETDSIAVYREMTARGVADYLGGSVEARDIADSLCRLFAADDDLPKGSLVAVLPAVGGAGASTLAAATASALAKRLGDAILLDMDLSTGTAALMMAVNPRDPISAALATDELDPDLLERFVAREGGVRILSTPGLLGEGRRFDAEAVESLLAVVRSMTKAVVVDFSKGWGPVQERVTAMADEVIVVARPDLASLRNSRMIVDDIAGRRLDARRPRLVLNGAGVSKRNEYRSADFAEAGGATPAASIPFDPEPLLAAIIDGRPIVQSGGKAMKAMLAFAETVLADEAAPGAKRRHGVAKTRQGGLKSGLARLIPQKQKA